MQRANESKNEPYRMKQNPTAKDTLRGQKTGIRQYVAHGDHVTYMCCSSTTLTVQSMKTRIG